MESEKKSSRGGARPGAGRPKGSQDRVSVSSLLAALEQKTSGQTYEEILIEDFLTARLNNDGQLVQKYHNLISNKVMSTLASIDVTESEDAVTAKREAFAAAIAQVMESQRDAK